MATEDTIRRIEQLKRLLDEGVITAQQFAAQRDHLLGASGSSSAPPTHVGPYHLGERLHDRSVGSVFRGRRIDRPAPDVAVVLLRPAVARDQDWRHRFLTTRGLLAGHANPGLPHLLEAELDAPQPWFAASLVEGPTLRGQVLQVTGPIPAAQLLPVFGQVLWSVATLHAVGVAHMDVGAHTIRVQPDWSLILDGPGIALGVIGLPPHQLTPGPSSAPEVVAHQAGEGPHADVYGLGVALYEALTGRLPFDARVPEEMQRAKRRGLLPPSRVYPGVPPAVDAVVVRCLAPDPGRRFRSVRELADALGLPQWVPASLPDWPAQSTARSAGGMPEMIWDGPTPAFVRTGASSLRRGSPRTSDRAPTPPSPPPDPAALARRHRRLAIVAAVVCVVAFGGWWGFVRESDRVHHTDVEAVLRGELRNGTLVEFDAYAVPGSWVTRREWVDDWLGQDERVQRAGLQMIPGGDGHREHVDALINDVRTLRETIESRRPDLLDDDVFARLDDQRLDLMKRVRSLRRGTGEVIAVGPESADPRRGWKVRTLTSAWGQVHDPFRGPPAKSKASELVEICCDFGAAEAALDHAEAADPPDFSRPLEYFALQEHERWNEPRVNRYNRLVTRHNRERRRRRLFYGATLPAQLWLLEQVLETEKAVGPVRVRGRVRELPPVLGSAFSRMRRHRSDTFIAVGAGVDPLADHLGPVEIAVMSYPVGATVTVDGEAVGKTPLLLEGLSPGKHELVTSLRRYGETSETVEIRDSLQRLRVVSMQLSR